MTKNWKNLISWNLSQIILIGVLAFSFGFPVYAQSTCSQTVESALEITASVCSEIGLNQACYGNNEITAELRNGLDRGEFATIGDIIGLENIETLALTPINEADGIWGIAYLSVQANLPGTVPGQAVKMLLLGDVSIQNAVPAIEGITVTANSNTRIRSTPNSEANNVVNSVEIGSELHAIGRTENGEWLKVSGNKGSGWIAAIVVDGDSERMSLPIAEAGEAFRTPMQAFYFQTGIGSSTCEEAPGSGLLIQTPGEAGLIELTINDVGILLGSTAFLQTSAGNLRISLVEGKAIVTALGVRQFVPAGTYVEIPMADDGYTPSGEPTSPQPYDNNIIQRLPLDLESSESNPISPILEPIEVAPTVEEGQVNEAIMAAFIPDGPLLDGMYRVSVISFEMTGDNSLTDGYCASGGNTLEWMVVEYGQLHGGFDINNDIDITSMTEFTLTNEPTSNTPCRATHRAVWERPLAYTLAGFGS